MNKDYLATMALETLSELGEARQKWVSTAIDLAAAEHALAFVEADARRQITELAGGAKALGSNEALREQALTVALASHQDYLWALGKRNSAIEQEAQTKQKMYTLNDALKLFKTLLEITSEV